MSNNAQKDLEVRFDSEFKFQLHVNEICTKITVIRRIVNNNDNNINNNNNNNNNKLIYTG